MDVVIRRDEAAARGYRVVSRVWPEDRRSLLDGYFRTLAARTRRESDERAVARADDARRTRLLRRLAVSSASALARRHLSPGLVDDIVATAARSGAWGEVLGEAARPDESGFALPPVLLCLDAVDTASSRLFEQKK